MIPMLFMNVKSPTPMPAWGYSFDVKASLNDHITIAPRRECRCNAVEGSTPNGAGRETCDDSTSEADGASRAVAPKR
jgi:hypothetical protein